MKSVDYVAVLLHTDTQSDKCCTDLRTSTFILGTGNYKKNIRHTAHKCQKILTCGSPGKTPDGVPGVPRFKICSFISFSKSGKDSSDASDSSELDSELLCFGASSFSFSFFSSSTENVSLIGTVTMPAKQKQQKTLLKLLYRINVAQEYGLVTVISVLCALQHF